MITRPVRPILTLVFLFAAACGGSASDCDKAVDKANSCNVTASTYGSCTGAVECEAKCVLDGSCTDIAAAGNGADNSVSQCLAGCSTN